jgi:hypothetical protein
VSTKDIKTSGAHVACDVCGRTLLRGERAEIYVAGGARRSVCELCTSRAVQEGWVREGTVPAFDGGTSGGERRRSLLGRFRHRRDTANGGGGATVDAQDAGTPARASAPASLAGLRRGGEPAREPRHVRAVPTSVEHKMASAVELFNGSEHRRTVAGVARSLGAPDVSVLASEARASVVNVVVSWELCWYRYEADLSDDQPSVRVAGQGYELDELPAAEREPNAVADENGVLTLSV